MQCISDVLCIKQKEHTNHFAKQNILISQKRKTMWHRTDEFMSL